MESPHQSRPDRALARAVGIHELHEAAKTIMGVAHTTPVLTSSFLDNRTGAQIFLKCENYQRTGAFKFRGAYNALARSDAPGVLTYSSGNHAQAIALASSMLGIRATIVMPKDAPKVKRRATQGYLDQGGIVGSRVVLYDPKEHIREELGARLAKEQGLLIIPPYDHPDIIAGQGTAAMELIEHIPDLDTLYIPCGGGGLLAGSAIAARAGAPGCRIIGVEPEAADDAKKSFESGTRHTVRNPPTIADGARTPHLGQYTFPIILEKVDEITTVSDDALRQAMRICFERLKLVVEPTGVLGLAAALKQAPKSTAKPARIGVILSGGNVDAEAFSEIIKQTES